MCGLFGVSEADADRAGHDTRSSHHALHRERRQADRERHAEDQRGAVDARRQHLEARRREEVFLSCRLAEPRDLCAGVDHPLLDLEDKSWRRSYQHTGVVQLAVYSCSSV